MKKLQYIFYALLIFMIPRISFSQDLVLDDFIGSGQYLNTLIFNDTSSTEFKNGTRVYVLKKDGIYLLNAPLALSNSVLNFRAEYGGTGHYDPTIYLYPGSNGNPPGYFANMAGGSITLKHIIICGVYEPVDSTLDAMQGGLIDLNTSGSGGSVYVDSCILKTVDGQAIRTDGKPTTVKVTNSIIADMGFEGKSNFGAGKGIDLRDQDVDTCWIENCTLVNFEDRIIRHYQANKGPIHNLIFNHNTVVNSLSYHGFLSLGRVDSTGTGTLQITNNLLVDHFALGADTAYIRQVEFSDPGELDPTNGLPRMSWILANPNSAAHWTISHNYYAVSDSGQAMLNLPLPNGPYYQGVGPAATYAINTRLAALGEDSNATFKQVDLTLANTPPLMTKLIRWIYTPRGVGGDGKQKNNNDPNFTKDSPGHWTYDYNRKPAEYYFDTLNCNFSATSTTIASMATTDGKVAGDPRWGTPTVLAAPVAISSASVDFGAVNVGSSKMDSVEVTNNTASDVHLTAASTNSVFGVSPGSVTISPSTSKYIVFTFTPSDTNNVSGFAVLTFDATGSPDSVALSGKGHSTTGVDEDGASLPKEFSLAQNYPNPFNPSTTINFALPVRSTIHLVLVNILGKVVREIATGTYEAGYHHVTLNASDLASGVYFYRLTASGFTASRKLMLLK